LPLKKPAFDYNISTSVLAVLDSIAAVANVCAALRPHRHRRLVWRNLMLRKFVQQNYAAKRWCEP
jgi:hypothetical protein